jgi:hypothetical protein
MDKTPKEAQLTGFDYTPLLSGGFNASCVNAAISLDLQSREE